MSESAERLKKYAGTEFLLVSDFDPLSGDEVLGLATQITSVLRQANWAIIPNDGAISKKYFEVLTNGHSNFMDLMSSDGVLGATRVDPMEETSQAAADALVQELNNSHIMANIIPRPYQMPSVLIIKVGKKPNLSETRINNLLNEISNSFFLPENGIKPRMELEKQLKDEFN